MKPQPCPTCAKKDPPEGGCSHIECPNRKPLTAPKRVGDGLIPPRGSGSDNH